MEVGRSPRFLDPDGVPFYGGTYFPPEPRMGMPSFRQVMEAVVEAWNTATRSRPPRRTRDQLGAVGRIEPSEELLGEEILTEATARLRESADTRNGGFEARRSSRRPRSSSCSPGA